MASNYGGCFQTASADWLVIDFVGDDVRSL